MGNTKDTWMQAAATSAQGALGIGIQRIGARYDRKQQLKTQEAMMGLQMKGEREMMAEQQRLALEMWEKTGAQGQMEQLKKAGLNPGLIYGMGGAGGATTGPGGSPGVTGGTAPYVDTTGMGFEIGMRMAQQRLMNAQAAKLETETKNIGQGGIEFKKTETEIEKLIAETTNEKDKNRLIKIQGDMMEIDKYINENTKEEKINEVVHRVGILEQQVMQEEGATQVERATRIKVIDTIRAHYATELLNQEAIKQGIQVDKQKIKSMVAQIAQTWSEIDIKGAAQKTNEGRLELDKQIKDVSDSTKLTVETVGKIIGGIFKGSK